MGHGTWAGMVSLAIMGCFGAMGTATAQDGAPAAGPQIEQSASMDPKAHPTLEVATIKPSDPDGHNQGIGNDGNHLRLTRETLDSMVMFTYGVHARQIVNAPDWMTTQMYDVQGVADQPGEPSLPQMQAMLAGLLADRFALKFHREQRDLPHWDLVLARGGPKIERSKDQNEEPDQTGNGGDKGMTMVFTSNSMPDFVLGMQYFVNRPIVNQTKLTGRYTFTLKWTPDNMKDLHDDAAPALFTALEEQLGLKLESGKGPVQVIVIDHVEKPSAN